MKQKTHLHIEGHSSLIVREREKKAHYDDSYYFEDYDIHLDNRNGLVVTLTTGSYSGQGMPIKDTEHVTVEDFRSAIIA
ncbi:hypothetical protein [Lentilactobacillus hilgardii]|uniref:hypothetical protein n=1 Tax=Lentilactobacillus hilgardii TaxID=1588 RepID=UPI0021C3C9D6|nr:hypothetical protein [Lentilactobacillus hilgardii]